jgi:hypothetical protein
MSSSYYDSSFVYPNRIQYARVAQPSSYLLLGNSKRSLKTQSSIKVQRCRYYLMWRTIAPILTSKLEDSLLSAVHYCLLKMFALLEVVYSSVNPSSNQKCDNIYLLRFKYILLRTSTANAMSSAVEIRYIKPCNLHHLQCDIQSIRYYEYYNRHLFISTTICAN